MISFFVNHIDKSDLVYYIDRLSIFHNRLCIVGWIFSHTDDILELYVSTPSGHKFKIESYGMRSHDIEQAHGKRYTNVRFEEMIDFAGNRNDIFQSSLIVKLGKGKSVKIDHFYLPFINTDSHNIVGRFRELLDPVKKGNLLEIGSRNRSGTIRRDFVPSANWNYTGLDIISGENVDVIGDAHKLSKIFPKENFDAIMAFSVLEHLLMPWKFVVELNKIMRLGGIGLFTTHQCWPLHDKPWDFWRFSSTSWNALLNRRTGFEIIDTTMGEPSFVVPNIVHSATDFADQQFGYLSSLVLFKKINSTDLDWPVELEEIIESEYPKTTHNV